MKNIKCGMCAAFAGLAMLAIGPGQTFGQTSLQIIGVAPTDEQAIRLTWTSISNEVYQIQSADTLIDTNTGTTTWRILYDNYPSQGTNTFWTDHGNYFYVPPILDPKFTPMRFYQVVDVGPDTTSDEPVVSIMSPTNGSFASGNVTVTVAAYTDQATLTTKLYVDGQEMRTPDSSTNWVDISGLTNYFVDTYVINTCEWLNEAHTLFATAECLSAPAGGPIGSPVALTGHAVSPFVPVIFSNLVTRIAFTQPFFDPSAGQTQQVSAVFAANVNWTLRIRDVNSNEVRTATGSGTSMQFNWDGTGDGETNLPAGVYYYYISAATNGLSPGGGFGGDSVSGFSSALSSVGGDSTELWAVPSDGSGSAVPLVLYPWGTDTNDLTIFEAPSTWGQVQRVASSSAQSFGFTAYDGGATPAGSGAPSSQATPAAPVRPPTAPMAGVVGTFGLAYQTYKANGASGFTPASPLSGQIGGLRINIENRGANNPPTFTPISSGDVEALRFGLEMMYHGWHQGFINDEDNLQISQLRGSGTPFNQVNIGFLLLHGVYGTSQDFTAGGCEQMYFPIASGTGAQYLRMSEMNFGGAGTNGLKWMAIEACTSLHHANWQSMQNQQIHPYNSNLRLLLGVDTDDYAEPNLAKYWADFMFGDTNAVPAISQMTIHDAWYAAAKKAYGETHVPYAINPMNFAVAGDSACFGDHLNDKTNTVMSGTWKIDPPTQVYPP